MKRYAAAIAVLLLTPLPASAMPYRMLVNHGVGWAPIGDYPTRTECETEVAAYALKHSVQAGCAVVGTLGDYDHDKQLRSVLAHAGRVLGCGSV